VKSLDTFDFWLKVYTVPRLVIIDEIGYLPIDRLAQISSFSSSVDVTNGDR